MGHLRDEAGGKGWTYCGVPIPAVEKGEKNEQGPWPKVKVVKLFRNAKCGRCKTKAAEASGTASAVPA